MHHLARSLRMLFLGAALGACSSVAPGGGGGDGDGGGSSPGVLADGGALDGAGGDASSGFLPDGAPSGDGGTAPSGDGGCAPRTCAGAGKNCGTIDDGCGRGVDCGACTAGMTCGLVTPNVCALNACVPDCSGLQCGPDPVCGTSCGSCTPPASCGGGGTSGVCGAPTPSVFQNGTRIVWETQSTSDGSLSYGSTFDLQLDVACYVSEANDGQMRCLPTTAAYVQTFFSDASCSAPLAYAVGAGCGTPTPLYARHYDANATSTLYPVTGAYGGSVYSGAPGSCQAFPATSSFAFYSVGAALAPSTFAAMTIAPPGQRKTATTDLSQSGTRLELETFSTTDGASGPWELYDVQLATECYIAMAGDQQERCIPIRTTSLSYFYTDASCTQPALETTPSANVLAADYAYKNDARGCPNDAYYRVGAPYSGTPYWTATGTCTTAPVDGNHAYTSLSPISAGTFQSGIRSDGSGPFDGYRSGSRLQMTTVTTADGARSFTGYHDAQLGVDCYVLTAGDGALRCVPSAMGYIDGYFADASCTTPLALGVGCVAPAFAETTSGCGASYYQVAALYTGATYFGGSSSCTATPAPTYPLYTLGAAIPASTFVPVTVTH